MLRVIPVSWAYAIARGLGSIFYRLDSRHRKIAIQNLRQAFGSTKSEAELQSLAKKSFQNFVLVIIESVLAHGRILPEKAKLYVDFPDQEPVRNSFSSGNGVLALVPHLGNWEIAGLTWGAFGFPASAIARPLKNPYLEAYLTKNRESTGLKILPRRGGFRQLIPELKANHMVALLPDQNQRKRPIFVNWFGRLAASDRSAAFLALRMQTPVFVGGTVRVGNTFRFRSFWKQVNLPARTGDRDRDLRATVEAIHRVLEQVILEHPDQYFWLHDRYRTRPPEDKV